MSDPYNRVFSPRTSSHWQNDESMNKHFISCQERFAQQLLVRQGYLYLNDAYAMLGLNKSDIGQVVGWRVENNDIPVIDFGIEERKGEIYIDFNVSGLIVGGKVQELLEGLVP